MRRRLRNRKGAEHSGQDEGSDPGSFDALLHRELDSPTVIELETAAGEQTTRAPGSTPPIVSDRADGVGAPPSSAAVALEPVATTVPVEPAVPAARMWDVSAPGAFDQEPAGGSWSGRDPGFSHREFWGRYDEATAAAELFAVPPAAVTVVLGPLDSAVPVARRCLAAHWVTDCDVFVLTERDHVPGEPTWTAVRRPSDVVAVLEDGRSDFPLLVVDVPRELPAWVRPLVARLRQGGVGLVHYVLDGDPSDEDLATWHGELGRPSVLDLAAPVEPERVLQLLDRGEPVASVAGMPITTELLLALRLSLA